MAGKTKAQKEAEAAEAARVAALTPEEVAAEQAAAEAEEARRALLTDEERAAEDQVKADQKVAEEAAAKAAADAAKADEEAGEYPEGPATGKFVSVAHKDGAVVFNPDGTRVTGLVTADAANDTVLRMNAAAGIKG